MSSVIPPHGGYRGLKSFQHAELIYDATVRFCDRFVDRRSRLRDQMMQATVAGGRTLLRGARSAAQPRNRS